MADSKQYNGWANYETWATGMWLDGNYTGEGTYREVLDVCRDASAGSVYDVARALEDLFSEALPEIDGIAGDLLGAAVSEIDWTELAEHKRAEIIEGWISAAKSLGESDARDAATWIADGNTDLDWVRVTLLMLADGDPASESRLPRMPDLSGEWADDKTPNDLAYEITGVDGVDPEIVDQLAGAYEAGVSETFESACETELRQIIGDEVS